MNEPPSLVGNLGMGWSISGKWEGPAILRLFPLFFPWRPFPLVSLRLEAYFEEIG